MIDFGAGTTDYVLYRDGMLTASGCVPLGGDHMTNDIAMALQIPNGRAEKLKVEEGSALYEDSAPGDMLRVEDDTGHVIGAIERAFLNEIIYLRAQEIFEQIKQRCEAHIGHLGAGIYLIGGVSLMPGIDTVARDVFGIRVPKFGSAPVSGVTSTFENPKYCTPIGLIRYAQILDSEKPFLSPLARLSRKVSEMLSMFTLT